MQETLGASPKNESSAAATSSHLNVNPSLWHPRNNPTHARLSLIGISVELAVLRAEKYLSGNCLSRSVSGVLTHSRGMFEPLITQSNNVMGSDHSEASLCIETTPRNLVGTD